ncbi:MAG: TIGR04086 family membrane protein [Roseburia sp.]
MEKSGKGRLSRVPASLAKVLLAMYILTGILLLVLAGLLYRFQLSEQVVNIGVIVIYILAGFSGGFLMGKLQGSRKFLWGAVMGLLYFVLLMIVSLVIWHEFQSGIIHGITTLVLCTLSGMVGGMIS